MVFFWFYLICLSWNLLCLYQNCYIAFKLLMLYWVRCSFILFISFELEVAVVTSKLLCRYIICFSDITVAEWIQNQLGTKFKYMYLNFVPTHLRCVHELSEIAMVLFYLLCLKWNLLWWDQTCYVDIIVAIVYLRLLHFYLHIYMKVNEKRLYFYILKNFILSFTASQVLNFTNPKNIRNL